MKKILVVLMSMLMAFALVACGGGSSSGSDTAEDAAINVVLEIDYPDESGMEDVEDFTAEIPEGGTVLAALNAYADANGCEVILGGTSDSLYITSIGGVAETESAGWVYEVNDEMVMDAADACILKAGDEVSWSFESWGE